MSLLNIPQPGDLVNEIYSEQIQSIVDMCLAAGDDPHLLIHEVQDELRKMVAEMMAEDERLLERKRVELASIRTRYQSLYHELHPDKVYPDYEHSLTVLPALRIYADQWEQLKEEHEQLLEREVEIRREESRLCHELQESSLQTENGSLLSKPLVTQISLLSERIAYLRGEKTNRLGHLSDILRMLTEFENLYGWKRPKTDTIIGQLLALGPGSLHQFPLSKDALDVLDKEFGQINEQIQTAESCFEQSNKQLTTLMRTHQSLVPNPRALAVTHNKRCRISKLPDLVAEVDRYKEHALEKLTNDILRARERIHSILNKLSVGDTMNHSKYTILYTNDFTEDVYFMHEELLQELEAQYEMNKSIYEQMEIWNELFLEFQEFEKTASDPQRFHRRGYSALTEEKTRRKLEGSLRDSEVRLQQLADDFLKKNHGQAFLISSHGREITDYIQQRRDEYTKTKEREREASKTPASKKKARTETVIRVRPAPLQSVPGSDENNNNSDENQCATTLCVPVVRKKKCLF